jgi:hypothetical protein
MKRGKAILLAASFAGAGAVLWAGAAGAQDPEPAGRAPVQVVVVNAPAPDGGACAQRAAYRDCGCYPPNATSVTVLDAPFQPGAMYFVNQPAVPVKHGRWR